LRGEKRNTIYAIRYTQYDYMTIQFNCPNCDALIAFDSRHSGKRAKCINCGQRFIIPSKDNEKPQKVELKLEEKAEPLPGFYRATLFESRRLFVNPKNTTGLLFVIAAVCFKFFVGHVDYSFTLGQLRVQSPFGLAVTLAVWGCLFWYYVEVIYSTAFNVDELPDIYMGGLFGFIWNIAKSLSMFVFALIVVELPCITLLVISRKLGFDSPILTRILVDVGLFAFPMAILTFAVGKDFDMVLRPSYLLRPIIKAFSPYVLVVALFILTWELQLKTLAYGDLIRKSTFVIGLHLSLNLGVQALALVAMRSMGLFYRHYSCYFPW